MLKGFMTQRNNFGGIRLEKLEQQSKIKEG